MLHPTIPGLISGLVPTLALLFLGNRLAAADQQPAPPPPAPAEQGPDATIQVVGSQGQAFGSGISPTGANSYGLSSSDIDSLPMGTSSYMTDVMAQMPGVAIDQYQMVHIRDNEGAGFQYTINGFVVPIDINTNPPFLSMINPMFVAHMELLDGILPAKYNYADGGVVAIDSKDGFSQQGGTASTMVGQRDTYQENVQYGASSGRFSYYLSGMGGSNDTAFSSATPGPNAIHDHQDIGQGFGYFSYQLAPQTTVSLLLSGSASNNQFPNVPGMPQQYTLAGDANPADSSALDSDLDMRDYLGMLMLRGRADEDLSYDLGLSVHSIEQKFIPDNQGELVYQGVSSAVTRSDIDYTAQGDVEVKQGRHDWTTGFYLGAYGVTSNSSSLVFPVDDDGNQTSDVPEDVNLSIKQTNIVTGLYLNDVIQLDPQWSSELGLRWDTLSGFTSDDSWDPRLSLTYKATTDTTIHAGYARQMQVPTFSGIATSAPAAYANTTGAQPTGGTYPLAEHDEVWDAGVRYTPARNAVIYWDSFFEIAHHYLDAGLFGDVPIYSPLNYDLGYLWDTELGGSYKEQNASVYANFTMGRNYEHGIASGQFNFSDPAEAAYINNHYFLLDHEPLAELNDGVTYRLGAFTASLDSLYSSGLRGGFADYNRLPSVLQFNAGLLYDFRIPGIGRCSDRLTILNIFDRVNLIRPASGIGVFQASYGPRFTVYDTLTIPF